MSGRDRVEDLRADDSQSDSSSGDRLRAHSYEEMGTSARQGPKQLQNDNAACEDRGLLPSVHLQDASNFVPGYTYTRQEAEQHFKELCGQDNWSSSDMEFMRAYNKAIQPHKPEAPPSQGHPESNQPSEHQVLRGQTNQSRFDLGAEADLVGWERWQNRMNETINKKLQSLMAGAEIPQGVHADVDYRVGKDGSFTYSVQSNNPQYYDIVNTAIRDTLKYHPELLKYPPGAQEKVWSRHATFNVNDGSGYRTGEVHDEINKR